MNEEPALGVYVHWPYCARICPYCDFNVYKNRNTDEGAWIKALTRDLEYWAAQTRGRKLTSLYFGGGTPSLAPRSVIEAVIDTCERLWGFLPNPEITIEANPTDAEQARFSAFAEAGVNRLSLGVQSLRDDALQFLGRDHSADEARRAIETAQKVFTGTTFDLIYARPDQTLEDWRKELEEALTFGVKHLSLYQLTIEPGTAFHKQVSSKRWTPAGDEMCADHFEMTQEMTTAAGLPAYEISNHAAPGAQSQHNLLYWTYQDYIGIGPGAHGRISVNGDRLATLAVMHPENYLKDDCAAETAPLSVEDQIIERFSFGLRLHDGMALNENDPFLTRMGAQEKLRQSIDDGLLSWDGQTLTATARGQRLLNALLYNLL